MNKEIIKPPFWFWLVSAIALLWNLMGVIAYLAQAFITDGPFDKMPEPEPQPTWVIAAFAIAVFGGTSGCIALLLRKEWARPIFLVSLIGIVFQVTHVIFISDNFEIYGPGAMIVPIMVIIVGVALVFFARLSSTRNWIR
ncbi:MAG: hypothetical protein AAFZ89_04645 [Bacteroidota bacterium]